MDALLARCRIGCQIAVLGLAGVLGMLLIGGINRWGANEIARSDAAVTAARDANDLESRLQIALLQARRQEKNFLLRHDQESLTLYAASIDGAAKLETDLTARLADYPANLAMIEQVRTDTSHYKAVFDGLAREAKAVALTENDGLQGALRDRVHAVEDRLKGIDAPKV